MANRLDVSRAFDGYLSRLLPVGNGLLCEPRLGVVMSQQFGLRLDQLGRLYLQNLGNALVILLPRAPEQRLIGCILNEGMLKDIGGLGWYAPLVEQFSFD